MDTHGKKTWRDCPSKFLKSIRVGGAGIRVVASREGGGAKPRPRRKVHFGEKLYCSREVKEVTTVPEKGILLHVGWEVRVGKKNRSCLWSEDELVMFEGKEGREWGSRGRVSIESGQGSLSPAEEKRFRREGGQV